MNMLIRAGPGSGANLGRVEAGVLITVLQNSLTCQGSHFAKRPRYAKSGCVGFWGSHLHFGFVIPLSTKQHTLIGDGKQHIPIWYVGFPRAL